MEDLNAFLETRGDYGSGYGCGDGSCYGSGSGSSLSDDFGAGVGHGDKEIKEICGHDIFLIDNVQTLLYRSHGNVARGAILRQDLTLIPCYVVRDGQGIFAHGKTIEEAMEELAEKLFEGMPVEERIERFTEAFERGKEYPVKAFYDWHNKLTGSCAMGREEFAKAHGIDIENDVMTVDQFLDLTENAYGGRIIKQLRQKIEG